jgi:diguanylate cyclase (GGDEF)-like protein
MFAHLQYIAGIAVSHGAIVVLALICLALYMVQLLQLYEANRRTDNVRDELTSLEKRVRQLHDEGLVARVENEFLREFVAQTELQCGIDVLFRRLVPNSSDHFAALLLYQDDALVPHRARGLCNDSRNGLHLESDLERRVLEEEVVELEGRELFACTLLKPLTSRERGRARQLVLFRVGSRKHPVAIVVTTSLFPAGVARDEQLALGRRLMQSVAGNITWSRLLQSRERCLKSTTAMLELRSITDRSHATPLAMIARFVDTLREMVGADRVSLHLSAGASTPNGRPIVRAGAALGPGIDASWRNHEVRLAEHALTTEPDDAEGAVAVDRETLQRIGVQSLVQEAYLAPVSRDGARVGVVCFSSRQTSFDRSSTPLVEWAGAYLGETLDRVLHQASAERRARQDSLTELANRGEFDARIVAELARADADDAEVSLLLIDLDHFKAVNDEYGHLAGDEVLRSTARVLRRCVGRIRSTDRALVARYGGEEIAVLLPGMGTSGAKRVADDLRLQIERQVIPYDGTVITVTASLGVSTYPESGSDADDLIAAADAALYRAKELGRNRVVAATPLPV